MQSIGRALQEQTLLHLALVGHADDLDKKRRWLEAILELELDNEVALAALEGLLLNSKL